MGTPGTASDQLYDEALDRAVETIDRLATDVGPRRPTSTAERRAAELLAEALRGRELEAALEPFHGFSTFAAPFGVVAALALLKPRNAALRTLCGGIAAAALLTEGSLQHAPLSSLLSRWPSQNLIASVDPQGEPRRTLVLMSHLDSSRSGLLFHPGTGHLLTPWIKAQTAAVLTLAAGPLLERVAPGRAAVRAARTVVLAGLALLAERELRGQDVPGANDNASGVAVAVELAAEVAAAPLASTRLVFLATGCEESGLQGSQAFLDTHDTERWLFLNFDSVGGPATLRYLPREGVARTWPADAGLLALAERIATERPELGLAAAEGPIGLTYDATPVLARGGRALTFVAGDAGQIPNYHHATDTAANIDPVTVGRALAVGRAMVEAVDAGEADG
jgi:Peptidase family M28